jgi:hypothetical protein
VDLDGPVAAAEVQGTEHRRGEHEEGEVLDQLPGEPPTSVAADRQPADGDAVDALARGLSMTAKAEHVDIDAPIHEGERFALDPRLAHGVLRVHHHAVPMAAHDVWDGEP